MYTHICMNYNTAIMTSSLCISAMTNTQKMAASTTASAQFATAVDHEGPPWRIKTELLRITSGSCGVEAALRCINYSREDDASRIRCSSSSSIRGSGVLFSGGGCIVVRCRAEYDS